VNPPDLSNQHRVEEFSALLQSSRRRLYAYIYSMVHNHAAADDVIQEVSMVLWRKFGDFTPGTDFVAWAASVARFVVLGWRRRQQKLPLLLEESDLQLLAGSVLEISGEEEFRAEALRLCIEKLPSHHGDLLRARYADELAVSEIAQRTRRSARAIYKMLDRVHALLLDCVELQRARFQSNTQPSTPAHG
jgi:RNA polymerase sigma-70 factor (ECF subfamily)